jgi:hypothetical protein
MAKAKRQRLLIYSGELRLEQTFGNILGQGLDTSAARCYWLVAKAQTCSDADTMMNGVCQCIGRVRISGLV